MAAKTLDIFFYSYNISRIYINISTKKLKIKNIFFAVKNWVFQ